MLSFVSCLFPVVVGWIRWHSISKEMKLLFGLFVFYIGVVIVNLFMMGLRVNTIWLAQIYEVIEYVVFAMVFSFWCKNRKGQTAIRTSIAIYVIIWTIAKFSFEKLTLYNTFTGPLESLLLAAFGISTLITLLGEEMTPMVSDSRFWISTGIILYCLGTLPVFALANKLLVRPLAEFEKMWTINWILLVVSNAMYAIAFFVSRNASSDENISGPNVHSALND